MLEVAALSRNFGDCRALDSVSLSVPAGSVFGLVGPNGAGKTTLLRLMAGLLKGSAGHVTWMQKPVWDHPESKQALAFVADDGGIPARWTVKETVALCAGMFREFSQEEMDRLEKRFGFDRKQRAGTMSKGNRKLAGLALALSRKPELLLMDEPIDGLDPQNRRCFWEEVLGGVAGRGMTVVISSHNLKELEPVCDTVGMLQNGRLTGVDAMDGLRAGICRFHVAFESEIIPETLPDLLKIIGQERQGRLLTLTIQGDSQMAETCLRSLGPVLLETVPMSLEDFYMVLAQGEGNVDARSHGQGV